MDMSMRSLIRLASLALLLTVAGFGAAQAQGNDAAMIGYRQKVMQTNGFHAGSIGAILKGEWPHKEDGPVHAKALAANAQLILNAFKAQTADVKTDAKPEIWKEWAKFEEKAKAFERETAKLADLAGSSDMSGIPAQMKAVGGACKSCHDDFRKPKEQSYKN
jgi:cytochrome c556